MKKLLIFVALYLLVVASPSFAIQSGIGGGGGADVQSTDCSSYTDEGFTCWDTDDNVFYVGDGEGGIQAIGPGTPGAGDIESVGNCSAGNCFSSTNPSSGSALFVDTDLIIHLDENNNSASPESFQILDGANTLVADIDETGLVRSLVGYDCIGAVDCDFGSGDVTDMLFTTDGGTVTLDGTISASGVISSDNGFDCNGAVDCDFGSADITDFTFTTDGTGTAEFVIPDGSIDTNEILDATVAQADVNDTQTIGADPANGDSSVWFGTTGLIWEGATSDTNEMLLISADIGQDATITIPDPGDSADTVVLADTTQTLTNKTIGTGNTVTINATDITDANAGTDITADLEEEGAINATAVTGNASSAAVLFGTGASTAGWDTTPALDCTDCTNIPAASDLHDITNVTLSTPGDGAVLCFTGTSNNSVDCTVGGDATATEDTGTLTLSLAGGSVAAAEMADADHGDVAWSSNVATVENVQCTGSCIGDAEVDDNITIDLATLATTLTITDNEATAETNAVLFTSGGDLDGGNLGIESDGDFTYTPSTGTVAATVFSGALTGNADTATLATTLTITDNEATAETNAVLFTSGGDLDGGNLGIESDGDLSYTPSTGTLAATIFSGNLSGTVTIADNESTAETNAVLFGEGGDLDGGNLAIESDGDLTYTPSTGTLAATVFSGNLTGNVTGNADTATALNANPTDCSSNEFANAIAANGDLTCAAIADADVPNTITVSNYLLLAGGTLTGEVTVDNLGLEFTAGDDHTNCAAFPATGGGIFYDDSEGVFKKCQDNVLSDLDTSGAIRLEEVSDPDAATSITFADTETVEFDTASDGEVFFTISLNAADLVGDTTALLITAVDNDDANYKPLTIQDDQDGTPDNLFTVDSDGDVLMAGNLTIGDNAAASMTITADNSGSVDPVITLSDGVVNVSTGTLQEGGNPVLTEEAGSTTSATFFSSLTNPTGSGGSVVFANTPSIQALHNEGAIDMNDSPVDDDLCNSQTGLFWYDDTDGRFEFCNLANDGLAPATLGGDITQVGTDCTSDDCFVSGGTGTTMESDSDFILRIDANDGGSNTFDITAGSGDTTVLSMDETGALTVQSIQDIDGPGTNWQITTAGAATFAGTVTASGFASDGNATPTLTMDDSDSASITDDVQLIGAATTTTGGSEDTDLQVWVYNNGTAVQQALFDGDVGVKLGDSDGTDFVQVSNAGVMTSQGSGSITLADANDVVDLETVSVTGVADTQIFVGDGAASGTFVTVSGDMTLANDGTLSIATGAVGRTQIDESLLSMQTHATDCTALTCDAGSDGEMCFEQDANSFYICDGSGSPAWVSIAGSGMTSFSIDGDNTSPQTITDGNTATFVGGTGIDTAASATDTVTFTLDLTELNTITVGSGTFTTLTFDAGATDPVLTASSGNLSLTTGTFTVTDTITADALTLGANENITLGAETLDHDGTDFVFSDTISATGINLNEGNLTNGGTVALDSILPDNGTNITIGSGAVGVDYVITIDGESDDAVITYDEDNNILNIGDTSVTTTGIVTATDLVVSGSAALPTSATPTTNATGEIALDTTIVDHQPLWQYYDGGENMTVIAIDTAELPATDNEIIKYDAATDKFVLEADSTGSALGTNLSSSTDEILSNNGTILLGGTGNTNNETLDFDFETTANTVGVATTSGVTLIDFGTIDLATDALDVSEGNIANVGDVQLDSLTADDGTTITINDNVTASGFTHIADAFISDNADPADAGVIRLGNAETIAWEASPASTDLTLTVDSSEIFQFSAAITSTGAITGVGLNASDSDITNVGDIAVDSISADATNITLIAASGTVQVESVTFTSGALTGVTNITTSAAEINGAITLANDETIANGTDTQIALTSNGNEDIIFDMDTATDNEVEVTTSTGVTRVDFTTLNLVTTGTLAGKVPVTAVSSLPHTVTAEQASGGFLIVTAAGDVDLPDVCDSATGAAVVVYVRDVSETVSVAVGDTADDIFYKPVGLLGVNNEIDSPGAAGDWISLVCAEANVWHVVGYSGTWTDGGTVD